MSKHNNRDLELDRACAYCENASPLYDRDFMLCQRKGVVNAGYSCRHFSYDPLKRVPLPRRSIKDEIELPILPD